MSYPPIFQLPPVPGTPNGPAGVPPFTVPSLPIPMEMYGSPVAAPMYPPTPFCFGLDRWICQNIPETATIPHVVDIPLQGTCRVLLNVLCATLVAVLLIFVLSVALGSLLF